ncbi:HNH endonuclease [Pseudomonas sp. MF6751]|uniref:HNH endonuclease signature motif containing protein n=1 Tax=Pseudomonas sp. MF6751 TaxID=2797528 RepID=UPI00190B509F|nr:HNH endonuclease signature motif containing protein [Pseudomonas sp. MF6751]MBK3477441.1 HNH endonuclease [Pseudomonas sp. MF6751]
MTRYSLTNPRPIPLDLCKENFVVDPESLSGLRWINGGIAGSLNDGGYWKVKLHDITYPVHRIVWTLTHGLIGPGLVVNHIDQDPSNNRIGNLEAITQALNLRHQGKKGRSIWYPVGITQNAKGMIRACYRPSQEIRGPLVSICPSFKADRDDSSERLNDMCAKALAAFIERDGPDSPTVASFYSHLPIEAILGPTEGYP